MPELEGAEGEGDAGEPTPSAPLHVLFMRGGVRLLVRAGRPGPGKVMRVVC